MPNLASDSIEPPLTEVKAAGKLNIKLRTPRTERVAGHVRFKKVAGAVTKPQRMTKPRVRMTGPDTYVYAFGDAANVAAVEAWERAHPPRGKPPVDNRSTT